MALQENLDITPDDLQELFRINPLAAEQLKSIVLRRKLAEVERKLAEATSDDQDGDGADSG